MKYLLRTPRMWVVAWSKRDWRVFADRHHCGARVGRLGIYINHRRT